MQLSTNQLWVVVYRSGNTYSPDTEMPGEVFTTRESALAFCAELNATPGWLRQDAFQVITLGERLDELRCTLRESGAQEERENRDYY